MIRCFLVFLLLAAPARAEDRSWPEIEAAARGQTVWWHAWAGDQQINAYIGWVAEMVGQRFGIDLRHAKVADPGETVTRLLAEKTAGRESGGSVDLVWTNGENFHAMKANGLLFGPFVDLLPNAALVDWDGKPTTRLDFQVPTEGYEAPWGMAQFNIVYDTDWMATPPRTLDALLAHAKRNPGRLTYPRPPDFLGSTFLKQLLIMLTDYHPALRRPVDAADFDAISAPLWAYLDALHPHLWRGGADFPDGAPTQRQMLYDGVLDIAFSFNPADASSMIGAGLLPGSARTFVFEGGTIGNTHFVAIPWNSSAREGAMAVANFLLSPEAQLRKQDPAHWGDFTVLAMDKLRADQRAAFAALPRGIATLSAEQRGPPLEEPHPSWMTALEAEWARRYGG